MAIIKVPDVPTPATLEAVKRKLNPRRFPGMSPRMAAIVGFVVSEKFAAPQIQSMYITSDGFVIARSGAAGEGLGHEQFIGALSDLEDNWERLLDAADLTAQERAVAERLFTRISDFRTPEPIGFEPESFGRRRPNVRVRSHPRRSR